jgi:hypothetical protein
MVASFGQERPGHKRRAAIVIRDAGVKLQRAARHGDFKTTFSPSDS